MSNLLEAGDRAPDFTLPACYGYKAGATSPSAEEKVTVTLKDFQDKKWVAHSKALDPVNSFIVPSLCR